MATTTTKTYTVQELSRYGFKANDVYVNFSKNITDSDKGKIVPGLVFNAEVYTADSGKEYVNKVLLKSDVVKTAKANPVAPVGALAIGLKAIAKNFPTVPPKPKPEEISKGLSADAWAAKDARISRQGLLQASLIALAPVVSLELLFSEAKKLADLGLEYVNQKS